MFNFQPLTVGDIFTTAKLLPPSCSKILSREALRNKPKNTELTPDERIYVCQLVGAGDCPSKVARDLNLSSSTVLDIVHRASGQKNGRSLPRPGRPRLLSEADERYILLLLKRNPSISHKEIRERTRSTVSDRTLGGIISKTRSAYLKAQKGRLTSQTQAKGPGARHRRTMGTAQEKEPLGDHRNAAGENTSTFLTEKTSSLEYGAQFLPESTTRSADATS